MVWAAPRSTSVRIQDAVRIGDSLAAEIARKPDSGAFTWSAIWKTHGKGVSPIRNQHVADQAFAASAMADNRPLWPGTPIQL